MKNQIRFLDGLRGVAAFYVLVGHSRWLLWEGFEHGFHLHAKDYNIFEKFQAYLFASFRYGHNAVLLFFVLSGFVIHLSTKNSAEKQDIDIKFWINYLLKRSKRIYPAFIFAITLTAILDYVGSNVINLGNYKTGSVYSSFTLNPDNTSISTFVGNMFFLMKTYVPVFGSNGATWSLSFEWWFYIIYPFFFYILRKNIILATVSQLLLFYLSLSFINWPIQLFRDIFSMMIIWWFGVLLAEFYLNKIKVNFRYLSLLTFIIPLIIYKPFSFSLYNDICWGLGIVGLISLLFSLKKDNIVIRTLVRLKWLGDCSYTIYIIHVPILFFLHSYILEINENKLPQHYWFVYLFVIFIIGLSYLLSLAIEKPFIARKKHI